jgi:hypothetical protein
MKDYYEMREINKRNTQEISAILDKLNAAKSAKDTKAFYVGLRELYPHRTCRVFAKLVPLDWQVACIVANKYPYSQLEIEPQS